MVGRDGSDRGQSLQVGLVVTFALLVAAVGIYTSTVVPQQNARTELRHSDTVDRDLQRLRTAMVTAGTTGRTRSAVVDLGLRYRGLFGSLFPPASGTLRTESHGRLSLRDPSGAPQLSLENYCGDLDEDGDTGDAGVRTRSLVYDPAYGFYDGAGTTHIGNTVKYRKFDGDPLTGSGQALVDGETIRLTPMTDTYSSTAADTVSVDIRAGAVGGTRFTPDQHVVLRVPTALPASEWAALLAEERVANGGHVESVSSGPGDTVDIRLEQDVSYRLSCRPLGLNAAPPDAGVDRLGEDAFGIENSYLDQGRNAGVLLADVETTSGCPSGGQCIELSFENRNGFDVQAVQARVAAFSSGPKSEVADLRFESTRLETYGPFTELSPEPDLPGGTTTDLTVDSLRDEDGNSVTSLKFQFFVVSVVYERPDTGERLSGTYFVAVPQ